MALQEADMGVTTMAFGGGAANPRYQGDEYLLVKFFMHPRLLRQISAREGRPVFEEQPYIQIMQPGNKDSIVQRPASAADKERFAEHWAKFQARESTEGITGTLLEEWPGVTRSQCEELKFLNIRTVEQLANVSDSNAQNIMGISLLKQRAQKYLEASKDEATSQALLDAQRQIAVLSEQMEALQTQPLLEPSDDFESVDETPADDLESVDEEPVKQKTRRRRKAVKE